MARIVQHGRKTSIKVRVRDRVAKAGTVRPNQSKGKTVHPPLSRPAARTLASRYFNRLLGARGTDFREMLRADPLVHVEMVRLLSRQIGELRKELPPPVRERTPGSCDPEEDRVISMYWDLYWVDDYPLRPTAFVRRTLARRLPFTSGDLAYILGRIADFEMVSLSAHQFLPPLLKRVSQHVARHGLAPPLCRAMVRLADAMDAPILTRPGTNGAAAQRKAVALLRALALVNE